MIKPSKIISLLFIFSIIVISCNKKEGLSDEQAQTFVKFYGGQGKDYATCIIANNEGYALTGSIFKPDSSYQSFLIATDRFGNQLPWSPITFGGSFFDSGNKIIKLQSGDYIIVGTHFYTQTNSKILVTKITSTGIIKWIKHFGPSVNNEGLFGLEVNPANIIIGGFTDIAGQKDICVYNIDNNGDSIGMSIIGSLRNDIGNDIIKINTNNYILGTSNSYNVYSRNEIIIIQIDNDRKILNVTSPAIGVDNYDLLGVKIKNINNNLLVLGKTINKANNRTGFITILIDNNLNNIFWKNITETNEDLDPSDLVITENSFKVIGNKKVINNSVFVYSYNINGILTGTSDNDGAGNLTANSAVLSSDGKICIAGSNGIQNFSQVAIFKGIY